MANVVFTYTDMNMDQLVLESNGNSNKKLNLPHKFKYSFYSFKPYNRYEISC